MKISLSVLKDTVLAGVHKLGYTGEDAQIITDVLLYAQLRGNNQGITKIATGGVPKYEMLKPFSEVKRNKCAALLSGGHSMVSTAKAADLAIALAQQHGVGIVGVNHTHTSSGAIGYFSRRVAKAGYIGIVCTGNGDFAFVAPTNSAQAKLGTNPFSYAFPYRGGEVVFDNATAAMAYFGIVEAGLKGEKLPEGIGYDKAGMPSVIPQEVLDGSITSFAGHKGYSLSLLVQLLGGPFVGAGTVGVHEEDGSGTFVLAIDPGLLIEKDKYFERATAFVQQIKSAKPLPGKQVFVPGEQGDLFMQRAMEEGEIEIADAIWKQLLTFVTTANT